jgi:nucleotide-binding universal stress UspA family protein
LAIKVTTDVRFGDPRAGITLAAVERGELIVMATHGRTGMRRALVGSVAGEVLRTGSTPVLLVHPQLAASSADAEQLEAAIHA